MGFSSGKAAVEKVTVFQETPRGLDGFLRPQRETPLYSHHIQESRPSTSREERPRERMGQSHTAGWGRSRPPVFQATLSPRSAPSWAEQGRAQPSGGTAAGQRAGAGRAVQRPQAIRLLPETRLCSNISLTCGPRGPSCLLPPRPPSMKDPPNLTQPCSHAHMLPHRCTCVSWRSEERGLLTGGNSSREGRGNRWGGGFWKPIFPPQKP